MLQRTFDSSEMALRGRIGGFVRASRFPSDQLTAAARDGFLSRFEHQVDPDNQLSLDERQRRALAARKAYMAQLAYRSAKARARTRSSQNTASHMGTAS